jgi:hypothetical protein
MTGLSLWPALCKHWGNPSSQHASGLDIYNSIFIDEVCVATYTTQIAVSQSSETLIQVCLPQSPHAQPPVPLPYHTALPSLPAAQCLTQRGGAQFIFIR